jgi:excinuclease ABC subunit B
MTDSMKRAIGETDRRREKQVAFNLANGITPKGVQKRIADVMRYGYEDVAGKALQAAEVQARYDIISPEMMVKKIAKLEKEMKQLAMNLEFEAAAAKRDEIRKLREKALVNAA